MDGSSWWFIIREGLDAVYKVSGIVLVLGVFLGLAQLRLLKKDIKDRNMRAAAEKSMEYLAYYQKEIISTASEYKNKVTEEIKEPAKFDHLINKDFILKGVHLEKELIADSIIKQRCGIIPILNRLEFFSAAVESRITDEELLYPPLSKIFCEFIEEEFIWIAVARTRGGAPYKNLISLYNKWSKRMEVDKLKLQMKETAHKIREQGNDYHSSPPIGF
ncbi:hypothetical protein AZ66_28440 [Paenibacillus sp. E194]|uniref:DUF4760 domain-containing protein n=1 Tax=Paenibacillus sp. E194 TaxID=1458845 RepID=UPI0005CA2148|nr:hypothetical protein [Paenibacillus sp. E194]KJB84846.1 hypothetical protein AZ66_28440 [Paenibacillus sp. E194]